MPNQAKPGIPQSLQPVSVWWFNCMAKYNKINIESTWENVPIAVLQALPNKSLILPLTNLKRSETPM